MRAAFRMPGNRFCVFINFKAVADEIVYKNIWIEGHTIEIQKLVNSAKYIIISNVYPNFPPFSNLGGTWKHEHKIIY